jgi:DNA polymerase III epsilon subunit-like protein
MQFMGEGIFVAHSVNFDYGFISYEYERLERRFRFPKLCTCAGCGDVIPAINPTALAIFARLTTLT